MNTIFYLSNGSPLLKYWLVMEKLVGSGFICISVSPTKNFRNVRKMLNKTLIQVKHPTTNLSSVDLTVFQTNSIHILMAQASVKTKRPKWMMVCLRKRMISPMIHGNFTPKIRLIIITLLAVKL